MTATAPADEGNPRSSVTSEDSGATMHLYRALRTDILQGRLQPGEPLSQVELATRFQVSRAPIREALRLLQTERLVAGEHNRRMRVAPISPDDFEQLYVQRLLAEPLGVRLTVPMLTSDDLDLLEASYARLERHVIDGGPAPYEPHRKFHTVLCSGAGPRLLYHIEELWDHSERYRRLLAG